MSDTDKNPEDAVKKWRRRAAIAGVVLALVCKSLPPDYQAPCEALARICTGEVLLP